ncbi:porin [Pararhizobium gei]|uniref:porin n=1 Tax=Pararhizobium gei TaxID=1395951 RepID=UPI0023DCBE12|nr:porin [Rhizobium gei]
MNIKSLLLGSAAALAAVSGAQAADAIVAAEPEAMEYVRVCDAFGTGYFYIPGTETCLKIGGYVRTQVEFGDTNAGFEGSIGNLSGNNNWGSYTRAYLTVSAKNDTEYGALSSYINLQADSSHTGNNNSDGGVILDGAWINIAGFDVGYFYNWWDDFALSGETEEAGGNLFNAIRYTYDGGSFQAGIAVEDLGSDAREQPSHDDDVGVSGLLRGTVGGIDALLIGSYDFDVEEAAFKARLTAEVGPGTFGIMGIYATDPTAYWSLSEWSVAAEYKIQATEKLFITPAAQYFGDVGFDNGNIDAWRVGVTAGYQITEGLRSLATVNYTDADEAGTSLTGNDDDAWSGFLRLQRDF